MQLGTENRNKTIAAIALMVVAVVFVVVRLIPDSPAAAKSPTPVVTPPPGTRRIVTARTAPGKKAAHERGGAFAGSDPSLRLAKGQRGHQVSGRGTKHFPRSSRDSETDRAGARGGRRWFRRARRLLLPSISSFSASPTSPASPRRFFFLRVKTCSLPARATLSIAATGFCTSRRSRSKWKTC